MESFAEKYDQKFKSKRHPRESQLHQAFMQCSSRRESNVFVRLATDCLLRVHTERRGFDVESVECRLCPHGSNTAESVEHMFSHVSVEQKFLLPLAPKIKRKIRSLFDIEWKQMLVPEKRIRLEMDPQIAQILAPVMCNPHFERNPRLKKSKKSKNKNGRRKK